MPELSPEFINWLQDGGKFPEFLSVRTGNKQVHEYEILNRNCDGEVENLHNYVGFKGFILKVRDPTTTQTFAAKLSMLSDYDSPEDIFKEVQYSSQLKRVNSIVTPIVVGRVEKFDGQPKASIIEASIQPWVCFISEWIEGQTLEAILNAQVSPITPSWICAILRDLVIAVLHIQQLGFKHDDLHLRNIMLEEVDEIELSINPSLSQHRLKIVDLGSLKPINQETVKTEDDWISVVRVVVALHNSLNKQRILSSRFSRFLLGLQEFASKLVDPSHSRFPEPSSYLAEITRLEHRYSILDDQEGATLSDPFEALSAEHLASDEVLRKLFEDSLPWIKDLAKNTPWVLTGPRGCGKSMVFKYQAFGTHCSTAATALCAIEKFSSFGIYISCSNEIESDVLWMRNKSGTAKKNADPLISFFNLVLARELCKSLAKLVSFPQIVEKFSIQPSSIEQLIEHILSYVEEDRIPNLLNMSDRLLALAEFLDQKRFMVSQAMLQGKPCQIQFPLTFIRDTVRVLKRNMAVFSNRPITFLLDDYTSHRLGEEAQQVFNSAIFSRFSEFNFKISCEPRGFKENHLYDINIENLREFKTLNASDYLLTGSATDVNGRINFATGLINKRLEAANYKGRVESLIGKSSYRNDVELADAIKKGGQGKKRFYSGIESLSSCWSGDVITTLFITEEMFRRAKVSKDTTTIINDNIQHAAITNTSNALVNRINYYHPLGPKMREFIDQWGDLARRLLLECTGKNGEPLRQYRIEVPIGESSNIDTALKQAGYSNQAHLLEQLVRRSILLELPESREKRKRVRTARYQIRASLLPKYGLSFTRKDYLPCENLTEFADFLNCDKALENRWFRNRTLSTSSVNLDLFIDSSIEDIDDEC